MLSKAEKKKLSKLAKKLDRKLNGPLRPTDQRIVLHRTTGDYDHTLHQFLVDADSSDHALEILDEKGFAVYGMDFHSAYDCTGRPFCDEATVKPYTSGRYYVALDVHYDV